MRFRPCRSARKGQNSRTAFSGRLNAYRLFRNLRPKARRASWCALRARSVFGSPRPWQHRLTPPPIWDTPSVPATCRLLERNLGKAPQLARMQPFSFLGLELFQRSKADLKMLADAVAVEVPGHAGQFDLAMQRGDHPPPVAVTCHRPRHGIGRCGRQWIPLPRVKSERLSFQHLRITSRFGHLARLVGLLVRGVVTPSWPRKGRLLRRSMPFRQPQRCAAAIA